MSARQVLKPTPKLRKKTPRKQPGPIKPGQHLLLKSQMLELVGDVSYSTVWGWMKDANFPRPIALGPPDGRTTKVAWIAAEVFAWIAMRPRRDIGGLKEIREAQERKARNSRC